MDHDCAGENEANSRGAFGVGFGLLLFSRNADIIPKVYLTLFHSDQITETSAKLVYGFTVEGRGVAPMKIEN